MRNGGHVTNRQQTVRYSAYNWQNTANSWSQNGDYWAITAGASGAFNGYPSDFTESREFGPSMFGGDLINPNQFVFVNMDYIDNRDLLASTMSARALGLAGITGWDPICDGANGSEATGGTGGSRAGELPGSCFRQAEIVTVEEETQAAYAMLRFGGPDARWGNIGVSGNVGVRYVRTDNTSDGAVVFPAQFSDQTLVCEPAVSTDPTRPPPVPFSIGCYLSDDDIAFNSGGGALNSASANHEHWLPSFNLKLDLTDTWVMRFAASRAMARPDIGNMKNYTSITTSLPSVQDATDPRWVKNSAGEITGVNPRYTASAYNPYLEPTTANQFDITLENYFDDVGMFSVAVFYKEFQNYLQFGSYLTSITNNGVTREVEVRGPVTGDGASVKGFELSYQDFFEFLPAPFDGLGIQANYTYVKNEGIENPIVPIVSNDGNPVVVNGGNPNQVQVGALEGLSEHSFNLVGMYEKGPWAARIAYNWRSEYLVTAYDCCIGLPVWQDAAGYLDASLRYRVNDNIELSISGSNLLDTETVLRQQTADDSEGRRMLPNGWFVQDRRLVVGLRARF